MQTFKLQTDVSEDGKGKKIRMIFSGYLTLQNAAEIKATLQPINGDFANLELCARDVAGIDVSFLQMIESYRKTHEGDGKKVKILMDLPYDLKTLLANAGIAYPLK
ncbi:MAG: hypothetical protein EA361_07150 [Bacteroidetes bacterium]|nr:MAG: hypothetical protein EA361_07150 [Bacteroidota bacterium]